MISGNIRRYDGGIVRYCPKLRDVIYELPQNMHRNKKNSRCFEIGEVLERITYVLLHHHLLEVLEKSGNEVEVIEISLDSLISKEFEPDDAMAQQTPN